MTAPPPPPPPPPPPDRIGRETRRGRRSRGRRILRAVFLGVLTGLAGAIALAYAMTGSVGPPPKAADVCREVPPPELDTPVVGSVKLNVVCEEIDATLELPLSGVDGFEGVFSKPDPPSDPAVPRPEYLVWESDGCSAPVLGSGPFDFSIACGRHDFGWRNLKAIDDDDIPVWHVENKDRVDAGFLYDMRARCASVPTLLRIGCDTTARVYYTAVRLNPSGVSGLPGRN
jgi:hypothetical protein